MKNSIIELGLCTWVPDLESNALFLEKKTYFWAMVVLAPVRTGTHVMTCRCFSVLKYCEPRPEMVHCWWVGPWHLGLIIISSFNYAGCYSRRRDITQRSKKITYLHVWYTIWTKLYGWLHQHVQFNFFLLLIKLGECEQVGKFLSSIQLLVLQYSLTADNLWVGTDS